MADLANLSGSCESHDWALGPACTLDGRAVGTINCAGNVGFQFFL